MKTFARVLISLLLVISAASMAAAQTCQPVQELTGERSCENRQKITLRWMQGSYDCIRICRDNVELDIIGGSETQWSDSPAPEGEVMYQVAGITSTACSNCDSSCGECPGCASGAVVVFTSEGVDDPADASCDAGGPPTHPPHSAIIAWTIDPSSLMDTFMICAQSATDEVCATVERIDVCDLDGNCETYVQVDPAGGPYTVCIDGMNTASGQTSCTNCCYMEKGFVEDFDFYLDGVGIAGQGEWETWDLDPTVDTIVSDADSNTFPSSLLESSASDIVRVFDGLNVGSGTLQAMSYIPSGATGRLLFILLNTYEHGGPQNWSVQIAIDAGTQQAEDLGGTGPITGASTPTPVVFDAWVPVKVVVDLDSNSYDAYYNGVQIMAGNQWADGTGIQELQCLDLWSDNLSEGYFDDVSLVLDCDSCCPFDRLICSTDCATGGVTLDWSTFQKGAYPQGIDIFRDGALIAANLPGDTSSFTDPAVPAGSYIYTVVGQCAPTGSVTVSCEIIHQGLGGASDLILALEGLQSGGDPGDTDSAAALAAALTALGRTVMVFPGSPLAFECLEQPQIVWVMAGTYPDDYRFTLVEGNALAAANVAGPGVYLESGDHWGFAHVDSLLDGRDGVDHPLVDDGDDTFTGMDGLNAVLAGLDLSAEQDIAYTQDQTGNDWTDQLTVATMDPSGPNTGAVWQLDDSLGTPYVTGVAYDTDSGGNFISSSFEFGGYAAGDPAAQQALAAEYVAFLAAGPPPGQEFIRGDANASGAFDIADAIAILSIFFIPGTPPPPCDDAMDVNDDGLQNIGDPIYLLSSLFIPGAPPPPPPTGICGEDAATPNDPLGCASFPPCP